MARIAREKIYKEIKDHDEISELEEKISKDGVLRIIDKFFNELRKPKPIPDKMILYFIEQINRDPFNNIVDFKTNAQIRINFWDYITND